MTAVVGCPIGQMFYQSLRARGVLTGMVIYPEEGHGIRQPRHQADVLRRVLACGPPVTVTGSSWFSHGYRGLVNIVIGARPVEMKSETIASFQLEVEWLRELGFTEQPGRSPQPFAANRAAPRAASSR